MQGKCFCFRARAVPIKKEKQKSKGEATTLLYNQYPGLRASAPEHELGQIHSYSDIL